MSDRKRIVVLGYIVRGPLGGLAWHHLQYVLGLARLGHDVCFLEDSGDTPYCCYDPVRHVTDADPTYGLAFAARAFDLIGLSDAWAYYDAHTSRWHGPQRAHALARCESADFLLNLSGANPVRPWMVDIPVRALIDTDPVFTQVRHLTDPARREMANRHTVFFSYGENIGRTATIPEDGFGWRPTRQPVVLERWPPTPGPREGSFTTVMQWDSYATREYTGRRFGMKSESIQAYLDIPRAVEAPLEIAVGGVEASAVLAGRGWTVRNPMTLIPDPAAFQRFVHRSKAEFTVAKHGYVVTNSGWFSDRSATYLASGRPVVTQNTGFKESIPAGDGLLTFDCPDEAIAAIDDVNRRYEHHSRAARSIAEEYFDSDRILNALLDQATA